MVVKLFFQSLIYLLLGLEALILIEVFIVIGLAEIERRKKCEK